MSQNGTVAIYSDTESLFRAAAKEFALAAHFAIETRGRFRVVLTGGSTPRRLYEILASTSRHEGSSSIPQIDWTRVEFFWSDERSVPPGHADSNFRMANESLLLPLEISPSRIHRMQAERVDIELAAREYQLKIAESFGIHDGDPVSDPPTFDLMLLGMGDDGHTASLFPGTEALAETERWVVENLVPQQDTTRMTLTFPIINRARQILTLVTGVSKSKSLAVALGCNADPSSCPIASVNPIAGTLQWIVDSSAASKLTPADRTRLDVRGEN